MEMGGKNLKCLATIAFICVFVWSFSLQNCHAREGRHWGAHRKTGGYRHRHAHRHRGGSGSSRLMGSGDVVGASLASKGGASKGGDGSGNFNVLDFGAKGDGRTDDTKVNLGLLIIFIILKLHKHLYFTELRTHRSA